jgi:tRNA dimethylallyltransferase
MTIKGSPILLVILGPTAVGKTSLSIQVAKQLSAEILSADSRQFYREMKIGTARPDESDLRLVRHHFMGHLSIQDPYNVSMYEADALRTLDALFQKNPIAILTGGSGLFIKAVCHGIDELPDPDPALREKLKATFDSYGIMPLQTQLKELDPAFFEIVDRSNPKRLLRALEVCITTGKPYSSLRKNSPALRNFKTIQLGLSREKADLYARINQRVDQMMEQGLMKEAEGLYPFRELNALNTVGYKELFLYFDGKLTLDRAIENIKTNSRRYAKRQMTWFRKENDIHWMDATKEQEILDYIEETANSLSQ